MSWQRQRTSRNVYADVDVDLDDFEPKQLLQALIDTKMISTKEAEIISMRVTVEDPLQLKGGIDAEGLREAERLAFCGSKVESLILLERALGGDFKGRLA